ncbi:Alpha/Beta hydrolase protein [Aspergillus floccosus]
MDTKSWLEAPVPKREPHPTRRNYWGIAPLIVVGFVILLYNRLLSSSCKAQPTYFEYSGEHIRWEPCGRLKTTALECSSINVPMDQFNASNSGSKTFTVPLIRIRGSNATQNLLLNPGGPGGSGVEFFYRLGDQLKAFVGEGFHLVSFDPRGVNSSIPAASCYPDDDIRKELSRVSYHDILADSSEVYAWAQNFAKACPDTMGEYGEYINTPQTAADMNSILDALGQQDMAYWGFSYGSLLGQTYAGLFPERSRRIIIDGVVDQFQWYEGVYEAESLEDTDKVLDGFFNECIKAGTERCALASLATSKEQLRGIVLSYMETLREQPIPVYINNAAYGLLNHAKMWYNGVFPTLYNPFAWAFLADNLYALIQGNVTDAFLAYHMSPATIVRESTEFVTLNDGLNGAEYWPQDRQSLLDKIVPYMNESLFGAWHNKMFYLKPQWTLPRTHPYVPRRVKTAHPLLIISTSYDPVCPLGSALSAYSAFEDSQIVEIQGYGHCSVSAPSLCAAKHIRQFLYTGKLPSSYTKCEVDVPYFINPEKDGQVSAQRVFEDLADAKIHLAQLDLARAWIW